MITKNRIVVITDCKDIAFNEIRAAILTELERINTPNTPEIDVEPPVIAEEFSLINGAFLTRLMADNYSPKYTTFLVILNPLRTDRVDRFRIIGETSNGFKFVGENTGTLSWLIQDFGLKQLFESSRKGIDGKEFVSFGGKYIHAPIAAQVSLGVQLSEIGIDVDPKRLTRLNIDEGTIVHIDNFGVPKLYGKIDNLNEGQELAVFVNGKRRLQVVFTNSMKNLKDDTWAIYKGSSLNHMPEICKVRSLKTAKELNVRIGDIITWKPIRYPKNR